MKTNLRSAIPHAVFVAAFAAGSTVSVTCAELEKEKPVQVSTAGPHSVLVGQTITLTAATANGSDAAYEWKSVSSTIATVDAATGVVTGVAAGEASITATGTGTQAVGEHAVVVVEAPGAPADLKDVVPNYEKWLTSAHADPTAEAFNHWKKEGAVPVECARCHSGPGFADYVGGDGSTAFQVDKPAAPSVITCKACHNTAADALSQVTFPSGVTINNLGPEARCMTCHQGRASGKDVDAAIKNAGVTDDDTANPMLKFTNIHYYPAAATLYAGRVGGGYQYPGQVYDARFRHVPGLDRCTGCHDPHSLKVKFDTCVTCHPAAKDLEGAKTIRMMSSATRDYNGNGDLTEGIFQELAGLRSKLLAAITAYGKMRMAPVCFGDAYPYWFRDTNDDGMCAADEIQAANGYASWTPRLLRAAYNYQMSLKDPGAFAHNAKYIMELLFDSTTDINRVLPTKVDLTRAVRTDYGHFNGAGEPARHWDANEKVDATCSKCHGGSSGFRFYVEHGVSTEVPDTGNGLDCATCHSSFGDKFDIVEVKQTTFPSGVVAQLPGNDNLCSTCHSGREAKDSIDAAIAKKQLRFINVHYLPAGGVKLGSTARTGYEYEGKTYAGPLEHQGGAQCTSCHDPKASKHTFRIEDAWGERCQTCHADANGDAKAIRLVHKADYDGDGKSNESLADELDGLAGKLLTAMRATAPGLCYGAGAYPYFFKNDQMTGTPLCAATEAVSANQFKGWTPDLMKASFNYQLYRVEPGAWAHNFDYLGQLLYDSVEALRGAPGTTGLTRP